MALALIKLKDSGNRFMDISGKGSGYHRRFRRHRRGGRPHARAGVLAAEGYDRHRRIIDPTAVTVWESGEHLSNTDPVNIVDNYSVYGYTWPWPRPSPTACCLSSSLPHDVPHERRTVVGTAAQRSERAKR